MCIYIYIYISCVGDYINITVYARLHNCIYIHSSVLVDISMYDYIELSVTMYDYNWLVVSTPLKSISQLGWLFPIYGKIKNVPNHQPDKYV